MSLNLRQKTTCQVFRGILEGHKQEFFVFFSACLPSSWLFILYLSKRDYTNNVTFLLGRSRRDYAHRHLPVMCVSASTHPCSRVAEKKYWPYQCDLLWYLLIRSHTLNSNNNKVSYLPVRRFRMCCPSITPWIPRAVVSQGPTMKQ